MVVSRYDSQLNAALYGSFCHTCANIRSSTDVLDLSRALQVAPPHLRVCQLSYWQLIQDARWSSSYKRDGCQIVFDARLLIDRPCRPHSSRLTFQALGCTPYGKKPHPAPYQSASKTPKTIFWTMVLLWSPSAALLYETLLDGLTALISD